MLAAAAVVLPPAGVPAPATVTSPGRPPLFVVVLGTPVVPIVTVGMN